MRDFAAGGVEVGFPTVLHLVGADDAGVFVQDAFTLAADFVGVFGARGADDFAGFFNLPRHAADAPAPLDGCDGRVDETRHAHLDGEFADGVDGAG